MLATPNGCVCVCGNDFDLNASGTQCLRQTKITVKNDCTTGEIQIFEKTAKAKTNVLFYLLLISIWIIRFP